MESTEYEAIRLRDIAELEFDKGDLVGAKRLIEEARQLYPYLGGAMQLSAILDVHIAAQVKVGINQPELDYYGILLVEPLSDESTIKMQYQNLAPLVHPDNNKHSMKEKAKTAFQLISKALEVLSNEKTRFQHDLKRGAQPTEEEPPNTLWAQPPPAPGAQASQAPGYTFSTPASPPPGAQVPQAPYTFWTPTSPATGTQAFQAPYIFWTACPFCRMQYQCMSIFLNNQVVCQNCHFLFPANDISVHPANGASAFVWPPGLWGNNNPFSAGSLVNMLMNNNYLAPAYGASTYGTFRNDLLSIFSGANPYGRYRNNLPKKILGLGMLLYAMNRL